jgi:hypothetical protein
MENVLVKIVRCAIDINYLTLYQGIPKYIADLYLLLSIAMVQQETSYTIVKGHVTA